MVAVASDLLNDSLFQVNLILWMLQPPQGGNVRPLLMEAGYKLRSIEPPLTFDPRLIARLKAASVSVKENAAPDVILATEADEHLIVECKAKMFGAAPSANGNDSNQRQARTFLLQVPAILSPSMGGVKVSKSHLAYLTKHDDEHDQEEGLRGLAAELKKAKLTVTACCVCRLVDHEGSVCLSLPKTKEKWPTSLKKVCKAKRGQKNMTIIAKDEGGNDIRPLYFIPWMPDSESQPSEYNRRVFGNRLLSAAVVRIGRTAVESDVLLNFDELLNEVTHNVFGKWRNKDAKKSLRGCARKLIYDHLKKTSALFSDPDKTGQTVQVKLSEEKIKAQVIKAFRETIETEWDKPEDPGLFDNVADEKVKSGEGDE